MQLSLYIGKTRRKSTNSMSKLINGIPKEEELAMYVQDKKIEKFDEYLDE